ncbi:hypothetical protein BUALT_Bualt02G0157800 [Buddleja alternifolia]|uniref:NB-ARC domain-containing protein n=1 Tax=Buddleja alternifolia TaxID=168488 RepID=A0AAV6YBC1_9LAMI|nr:hypothetical protein BUALT_Bualt02G0157800 [Buddleja alternifolia]
MAYNLESLVQILNQILHNDHHQLWIVDPEKKPQIESLLEKACTLKELFENSSLVASGEIQSLESRLTEAIYRAEDAIESNLADQILLISRRSESFMMSPPDLNKVIGEFDAAKEEIMKIMDGSYTSNIGTLTPVSSRWDPNPKSIVVGFSNDLIHLKDRLTGQQSNLEIIPIVGMGGIGKTTLARNVYDDLFVISHFDTRAWITISQEYSVRGILLGLLGCVIDTPTDEMLQELNNKLAVRLHKILSGQRYLIVLDDIWSIKAWDDVMMFFPNDDNGSRIMVTTRETNVADYVCSNALHHKMRLLNDRESWNLLREKVFLQETCPPELEQVGKQIAKNCGGLPLALHVIGGTLSQTKKTIEFWEQVADNVSSAVADKDERFLKILSLSYNHLPNHLRPCFLYMGAFPEDYEIRASKLIKLWIAEGFLKQSSDKSLEETAQVYLKALVDRNLIFVRQRKTNGKVKSYTIHDLLRDLCMKKACQENFLYVKNQQVLNLPQGTCLRRVSAHSSRQIGDIYSSSNELETFARSFLYVGSGSLDIIMFSLIFRMRLLRILDVLGMNFDEFPEEILQLVNLRYLALSIHEKLPSSISRLWNLQTLIVRSGTSNNLVINIPPEIWNMPQLRHIKFKGGYVLFDCEHKKFFFTQVKLQSLSTIMISKLSHRVFETIPNVKKLAIICTYPFCRRIDLTCLEQLETLKCSPDWSLLSSSNTFLSLLVLPASLKNLTLTRCPIPLGSYMNQVIGGLPNLETLKLSDCNFNLSDEYEFRSPTWEVTEGGFLQLKFLLLEKLNLVNWIADEAHFPRLEHLVIKRCYALREIPNGVGDISTLQIIEVHNSSISAVDSARRIQEEQLELGNYDLQVRITMQSSGSFGDWFAAG